MVNNEVQPINPEIIKEEVLVPNFSPEKKDLATLQTKVETNTLKEEIVAPQQIDNNYSYELVKWSKMYDKFKEIGKNDIEIKEFAENINGVVWKYLDQELEWFPNSIKNSINVGIQFSMMETLIKQWSQWSTQFFEAFSTIKSKSSTKAFEWLYKAFGMFWSTNEFFLLANKVQNIVWYLSDKKNIILWSENIPELMNPSKFKTLLSNTIWSNQKQIDKIDISTLLTLNSSTPVDVYLWEDELKKIINNDAISWVITEKTIDSIQKSLKTTDKLLDSRYKIKTKSTQLIDKIASVLDINIPWLGNLGEMIGMNFPTDVLWEKKDWWVLNFVLGALGFHWWLKWLHKEYIKEKLDDLAIDNTFIRNVYSDYQKNIDTTITHDSSTSVWKTCELNISDPTIEATIKTKLPTDYNHLKKSLLDNLDKQTLNPTMVAKFAPEMIVSEKIASVVDSTKVMENKEVFIDTYLKYIIPLLANPDDDFITSKKIDQNWFILAVIWGLVGDKYFVEAVNIWLLSVTDFLLPVVSEIPSSPEIPINQWNLEVNNGKIDFSKGKFTPEQIKNIHYLIDEMKNKQITDPNTQIGILSVIGKESGFVPKNEISYENTSNQDIRKIFWNRVPVSDDKLTELKKNPERFFNTVYATTTWNNWWNDGRMYRGRGYNQLTGKDNYKFYSELTGTNILQEPDLLNDSIVAAKVALAFFTQWKKSSTFPSFTTKNAAAIYFADINAWGHPGEHRSDALQIAENFDIQTTIA